ncbi:MAG: acetyl-CoA C-acetyltransferase [Betaproteobacteria bacterium]|nr:acetyl-CoA C-acetyltransferase [Betaproteobacteria bacterium]MDE2623220.1 acetyl-CoA C-acetyltransferase [Betaproteobacteria bacterium]
MRPVYLVDGARTPFLKARGVPGLFSASDLATQAGRALLLRQPFEPSDLSEVIIGCAAPAPDEVNIGRLTALRLGCGDKVPGFTVMRNCASGMQALDSAWLNIGLGRSDLVLAGGTDALSRAAVLFSDGMVQWLARWNAAKTPMQKAALLTRFKLRDLAPVIGLLKGLTDPTVGLSMGQTAEELACRFGISRQAMDAYAVESHRRALAAQAGDPHRVPLMDAQGKGQALDDGVRADAHVEKLATLRPVFDKPYGHITAGNSSQVTDGAALLLLASENALARWNLKPLARLVDGQWAALSPAIMGLGPVHAATPLLERHHLTLQELDTVEINEAFAAQVLACLAAWQDVAWCRQELGRDPLGAIDPARLNPYGGAIAVGHPVGASGARIVLEVLRALKEKGGRYGLASICIGGGQGGAMLIEALP